MTKAGIRVRTLSPPEGEDPGHPILLLHGFTGSVDGWGEGVLEGLSRGGTVLALDLPGHGESDVSREAEGYTMERIMVDLHQLLDEHGVETADWVGYSMGARIALAAAVQAPKRIRRLVLESGSPGLRTEDARARRRRQDELLAQRIEKQGIESFVDYWMGQPLFATQRRLPVAVLQDARRRRLRNDPVALARVLRGLGTGSQPSYWDALKKVKVPTLLVTGELDTRYTEIAGEMAALLPRARHVVVPGSGHNVHLEVPRPFLEVVGPWLRASDDALEGLELPARSP
jgi:2-succinyl-6-hydroxy-2,4-cyclohexadiene-1-carboxylate synthase